MQLLLRDTKIDVGHGPEGRATGWPFALVPLTLPNLTCFSVQWHQRLWWPRLCDLAFTASLPDLLYWHPDCCPSSSWSLHPLLPSWEAEASGSSLKVVMLTILYLS